MGSDKKVFLVFLIVTMLFMDSTSYPKSLISLGGVAARSLEASAAGTTSYNVINGADGTIYDNGPDNVGNGNNTSSQELPPPMSAPAPSTAVPVELPPPTIVPVELPPPTSVSTPSNVVPVYGGRYGYPWWPFQVSEYGHGDSAKDSASESAPGEKQKQLQP
ncbi:uncharacterized protein LOC113350332 [Papaver somniferum]|uniref:uncharacterized protein LOC113350332 n=1 Tax=Papaver somniferum TaxID=3469 RepID=UPI000E7054A3|nr:uncharacterized protein LOC113350332 [Papaver somniferum]